VTDAQLEVYQDGSGYCVINENNGTNACEIYCIDWATNGTLQRFDLNSSVIDCSQFSFRFFPMQGVRSTVGSAVTLQGIGIGNSSLHYRGFIVNAKGVQETVDSYRLAAVSDDSVFTQLYHPDLNTNEVLFPHFLNKYWCISGDILR
jgi:hypothetical protein